MLGLSEIFNDSFKYPTKDWYNFLILGVIILVYNFHMILDTFNVDFRINIVFKLVSFVVSLLLFGYLLSILKESILRRDLVPSLDFAKDFVYGIKVFIIGIVYYIIPIFLSIFFLLIIAGDPIFKMFNLYNNGIAIPEHLITNVALGLVGSLLLTLIFFIIFTLFYSIGICRFAKYDSLSEAFQIKTIFEDISKIGWFSYIGWYVIMVVLSVLYLMVLGTMVLIFESIYVPAIGLIINYLLFVPFFYMLTTRSLGLLYSNVDEA